MVGVVVVFSEELEDFAEELDCFAELEDVAEELEDVSEELEDVAELEDLSSTGLLSEDLLSEDWLSEDLESDDLSSELGVSEDSGCTAEEPWSIAELDERASGVLSGSSGISGSSSMGFSSISELSLGLASKVRFLTDSIRNSSVEPSFMETRMSLE